MNNVNTDELFNMDEISLSFDIPNTRTVASRGEKTIAISTAGHEKTNFTVVLGCAANGRKLKPLIIFKRATIPREDFPRSIIVTCNKKVWMNEDAMKLWVTKCFKARQGNFLTTLNHC